MLDRYFWGKVKRISPEAPVPVVRVSKKTGNIGGAGNVALNLAGLGCRTFLFGVRGDDSQGRFLEDLIKKKQIDSCLIKSSTQPTTTKTRIIGQGQQIVRLDEEQPGRLESKTIEKLIEQIAIHLKKANAVILSDYNKGIFQGDAAKKIISLCQKAGIPVFVDPKGRSWERYQGAFCITPNSAEFKLVSMPLGDQNKSVGDQPNDWVDGRIEHQFEYQAQQIIETYGLEYLMLTKGSKGISLFGQQQKEFKIKTQAREVFDVSGAGDTVIATLCAARASGCTMKEAATLANQAAGIVVGKLGTQPISAKDLKKTLNIQSRKEIPKLFSSQDAREIVEGWGARGKKIVFTNGCFDILHIGHIQLLHAAAAEGDKLILGLNSDQSVKRLKGELRPVTSENERAAILSSIIGVDIVVIFEEDTPLELIRLLKPDVLVKGGDYTPETVVGHQLVEENGGKIVIVPLIKGISTSQVIKTLKRR